MSTLLVSAPVQTVPHYEDRTYVPRSFPQQAGQTCACKPLLKLASLYILGLANCVPAWQAIANSMTTVGLLLAGVSFLLIACSFEVAAAGSPFEDTF